LPTRSIVLIVPGRLSTRTGGYEYDRRIAAGLRDLGWSVDIREIDGDFPYPSSAVREEASRVLASIPSGAYVLIDGLALGAMPAQIEHEASRLNVIALVHMSLAADVGIDPETAAALEAGERRALSASALIVVTGASTADALVRCGVTGRRIVVVEPGTDRVPLARGSGGPLPHLLCVATLNPGKGHDLLFRALAAVPKRTWRLTCAGNVDRSRATVERLRTLLRTLDLENQVSLVGELDAGALARCYDEADLFVLATLHETYGMAVAEALARGLPVVATATGSIPELVFGGSADAGIVVPPGNLGRLTEALSAVISDAALCARLAAGARAARERLPSWEDASRRMAAALEGLMTNN
jgi:glycosyltransferase involved in cell wall biosynthesis